MIYSCFSCYQLFWFYIFFLFLLISYRSHPSSSFPYTVMFGVDLNKGPLWWRVLSQESLLEMRIQKQWHYYKTRKSIRFYVDLICSASGHFGCTKQSPVKHLQPRAWVQYLDLHLPVSVPDPYDSDISRRHEETRLLLPVHDHACTCSTGDTGGLNADEDIWRHKTVLCVATIRTPHPASKIKFDKIYNTTKG